MKMFNKYLKIATAMMLALMCISMLAGCALLDAFKKWDGSVVEVTEDSVECANNFISSLSEGDIEAAEANLHPGCTPAPGELEAYIEQLEETHSFDFTEEISFEFSEFAPEMDLEHIQYTVEGKVTNGDQTITLSVTIRKDADGFGIYKLSAK